MNTDESVCVCWAAHIFIFVCIIKRTLYMRLDRNKSDEFNCNFKKKRQLKIKSGEQKMSLAVMNLKHPKVHVSMGLVRAVSHLKSHRQEGRNVGEE